MFNLRNVDQSFNVSDVVLVTLGYISEQNRH